MLFFIFNLAVLEIFFILKLFLWKCLLISDSFIEYITDCPIKIFFFSKAACIHVPKSQWNLMKEICTHKNCEPKGFWIPVNICIRGFWIPVNICIRGFWIPFNICIRGFWIPVNICIRGFWIPFNIGIRGFSIPVNICIRGFWILVNICIRGFWIPVNICIRGFWNFSVVALNL